MYVFHQSYSKCVLMSNDDDVMQLTDEERVYLNAAAMGDVPIVRQSLDDEDAKLNINCVDYMGRSALHLAVDSENLEAIELLLGRVNFHAIEEALLHAISKVHTYNASRVDLLSIIDSHCV